MKLIVGLGNPGDKYKNNRHNVGSMVLDVFAIEEGLTWKEDRDWICYFAKSRKYILIKPTTFMNGSGESVKAVSDYFGITNKNILVVHDELDLEFGKIRLSYDSSSAGHNGVKSVDKSLGTQEFARLRIGIGRPAILSAGGRPIGVEKYVLEDFIASQKDQLPDIVARCQEAIKCYVAEGIEATMNKHNK